MSAVLDRPPGHHSVSAMPQIDTRSNEAVASAPHDISDAQAGYIAVAVVLSLGLLLCVLITAIVIYATSWGYGIRL